MKKLLAACVCIFAVASVSPGYGATAAEKPRIDLYVEATSQNSWQMLLILNAVETRLPGRFRFAVAPLVLKDPAGVYSAGGTGPDGLEEAGRMLTVKKLYPERMWNYIVGRSMSPWSDGWRDAAQFAGIDPVKLEADVARTAKTELAEANEKQERIGIKFPMLFINDMPYSGEYGLIPLLTAFNEILPKAKRCTIPKIEFSEKDRAYIYVVVSDEDGFGKEDPQLSGGLKRLLKAHKPEYSAIPYSKASGMAQFKDVDMNFLPFYAIRYNPAVAKTLAYPIKNGLLVRRGELLVVNDTSRAGVFVSRPKAEKQLELFVMAQCPFGVQALDAVIENRKDKTWPEDVPVRVHYIVTASTGPKGVTFDSLHGTAEWEEAVRQLLINEKYPEKFWDYLTQRNKDYRSSLWEAAAEKAGIAVADIQAGFEHGKTLLERDAAYVGGLGIGASPTLVWEGRVILPGLDSLKKLPGFEKIKLTGKADGSCSN
ncbi:MAG: hypothetical protein PHW69_02530 [Elusimicrobiaceae bacterium]|nr:hypothetical protein [Elusimicrobiaceae bacterium]